MFQIFFPMRKKNRAAGQRRRSKYLRGMELRQVELFDGADRADLGNVRLEVSFDTCS